MIYNEKNIVSGVGMNQIKGCAFLGKKVNFNYLSRKNTEPNKLTGERQMMLYESVATGILTSQSNDFNIFVGDVNSTTKLFVGCFTTDKKHDYFSFDENGGNFMATDIKSPHLFKMIIAADRYLHCEDEIDENFRLLNLSGFVDVNQEKEFYTCADGIYYSTLGMLGGKEYTELNLKAKENNFDEFKKLLPNLKEDITAFVQKDYNEKLHQCTTLIKLNKKTVVRPIEIEVPKTEAELVLDFINKDYKILKEKDIKKMPIELQDSYHLAQAAFEENKKFFSLADWQLISQIKDNTVSSLAFIGPTGCGKTTTIRAIAGALGLPFLLVGGSSGLEESDLFGYQSLTADANGVTVTKWIDGPITTAIRYGAFLLFDEANSAEPGVVMKLNTILDGSRIITLPNAETVKVHDNFKYAEAMNFGAGYSGTDKMNLSHFDRLDQIYKIKNKTVSEEALIVSQVTGYENLRNIEKLCLCKERIMDLIRQDGDESEQAISTRRIIQWVKRAKVTGEFIESSLNTVLSHITIYDDSISSLSLLDVSGSETIASTALAEIEEILKGVKY